MAIDSNVDDISNFDGEDPTASMPLVAPQTPAPVLLSSNGRLGLPLPVALLTVLLILVADFSGICHLFRTGEHHVGFSAAPAREMSSAAPKCPGALEVDGYHKLQLIPEGWKMSGPDADDAASKPGNLQLLEGGKKFRIRHGSRVYLADKCIPGEYDPKLYANLKLLGKKFRFTANIKGVHCGCNAAMYFTPMHQNTHFKNRAGSYYCDANYVGAFTWGKKEEGCQELDILEGNSVCIHSTLHAWIEKQTGTPANGWVMVDRSVWDHDGIAGGNGGGKGGGNGPRTFTNKEFAPGSKTINTDEEFEIVTSFFEKAGKFDRFVVELHQETRNLTVIDTWWDKEKLSKHGAFNLNDPQIHTRLHGNPKKFGYEGPEMDDLTKTLKAGVTPIFSFWSDKSMEWMDGPGNDGLGPCKEETMGCEDMHIEFGNIAIEDI